MITWADSIEQYTLPCVAIPQRLDSLGTSAAALTEWVRENLGHVTEKLHIHGAVLFRGFSFDCIDDFDKFADIFCPSRMDYVGGNSPRTKVKGMVYTATEYPKSEKISLHNEASYSGKMPRKLLFYCEAPPKSGGQTPLADCRKILQRIAPDVRERFAHKRVKYVNNLCGGCGFGRSWHDVFQTTDKAQVEQWLKMGRYEYTWKADGGLRTSIIADGITKHPETKEEVWINQAEQWHPSNLDSETREGLLSILKEEDLPHNALFGDGAPLIEADLKHIRQIMTEHEVMFEWAEKDVLLCDNYLVAHGRQPFTGERKIFVAMG